MMAEACQANAQNPEQAVIDVTSAPAAAAVGEVEGDHGGVADTTTADSDATYHHDEGGEEEAMEQDDDVPDVDWV